MTGKRINLRLNQYQTELLETIQEKQELLSKNDNEVIRFIIEDYYKQMKQLDGMKECIKTKLNFISRETSMILNSLLNLIDQQQVDILKSNDQMLQYYQADKIFNNEMIGQNNRYGATETSSYSPEEIESMKRRQRAEQRKELAKKMKEEAPKLYSDGEETSF